MTGNRRHRSGAAATETGAAAALSGSTRRRFAGAARFVTAAVLVCAGAGAQAQSFYLDDEDLFYNVVDVRDRPTDRGTQVFGVTLRVTSGSRIIQNGVTYSLTGSDLFEVHAPTRKVRAARDIAASHVGHHSMTLTAEYQGETDDLRLIIGVYPASGGSGFSICDRTPAVTTAVLTATPANDMCGFVGETDMARITEISLVGDGVAPDSRTLFEYDFWGMSGSRGQFIGRGLESLYLTGANLNRLPPDLFANFRNLEYLTFYGGDDDGIRNQDLTEFPARLIADLQRLSSLRFSTNPGDSISGIRYSLDGEAVEGALMLEEGRRYNLGIEVDGGVRHNLTLNFRSDNPSVAAPATVTIREFSNQATVRLETPVNLDIGERQDTTVAWAWTQFSRNSRYRSTDGNIVTVSSGAEELRTPGLRVVVLNTSGLEDTDPAPNQISEAARAGATVSGWSPQVLIRNVVVPNARYSLLSDAGPGADNLFEVDAMTGALSLASERTLSYAASTSHEVTVAAQVTVDSDSSTVSRTVLIAVTPELALTDTDSLANLIASRAASGMPVVGLTPVTRLGGSTVTDGVVYSLDGPDGLFTVNTASGVISSARLFMNDDIRAHSVTLTATYRRDSVSLPLTINIRDGFFICDRTPQIRDRIVALTGSAHGCNFVPSDALATVTMLNNLGLGRTEELLSHDFDGMTGLEDLNLSFLGAPSLPEDIFRDTANLRVLNLFLSRLRSLPPDIFMNLNSLENLDLVVDSDLTELPARLLADLENLDPFTAAFAAEVRISGVQYRLDGEAVAGTLTLDEGVRHRLQIEVAGGVRSALTLVFRSDGELPLTAEPATIVFNPLSNASTAVVELTVSPDLGFADRSGSMSWGWGMYTRMGDGVPEIRTQALQVNVRNTETFFLEDTDSLPNTISVSATAGTRVAGLMPAARIGRVGAAAAAVGAEYALDGGGLFGINTASGVISSARPFTGGDRGSHAVTLTATYRNAAASLPLAINVLHSDGGFDICGRTPVVRDELLRRVNEGGGTLDCTDVPAANLAAIPTLDFSANPATDIRTLQGGDFDGLSGLAGLNLRALGLRRLPPDIFEGLANLRMLNLQDSRLTSLPARLLADLERSPAVTAGFDAGVLIGGVQYRADGEVLTELALDEGASRRIRIEVAGGVGSTWTLVARPNGTPLPVVMPETVSFSPGADAVIVEVTAPRDDNFDSNAGSVSWAWTMFNAAGAVNEIRTQTLRLDVREQDRFEDIDPAPNQISEAAAAGDPVSGWSPQVLVRGVAPDGVRYRLSQDAGGLFGIDPASGALSLVAYQTLDYTVSSSHQVTVAAEVAGVGTVSLAAVIEVIPGFVIRDTDTSANIIAATAATGTLVGGMAPLVRAGARVLTDGVVYSLAVPDGLFTVNTATGLIFSARPFTDGEIRAHPVTLTASHTSGTASLPLTIEVRPGVSICDRTSGVQAEILGIINNRPGGATYNCHVVRPADLASISTLNLSLRLNRASALLAHDFDGMTGLTDLNLRGVPLATLPEGIFSDTTNLRVLNLGNNRFLTSLPPNTFSNLGQLENLDLSFLGVTSLPGNIFSGLSNLRVLDLSGSGLTSLPSNLFRNLSQLQNLNLGSTRFTSLPGNIFSDLNNLRVLNLFDSSLASVPPDILMNLNRLESFGLSAGTLTELPARLLADLERIGPRVLRVDTNVRIGGIQYRAGGAPITELTLEEGGGSRNLQVEAVSGAGDVRSTLTLVFRPDPESGLAATPATIRLTPARRMAAVALEVPQDLNIANRSGPASWAWRFNPADAGEVIILTTDLQVSVRDTHRFEDTDPNPNQIRETASLRDPVSGWSPQVVVGGNPVTDVSYSLSSDAGGLFTINAANGELSLAPGQALDYATSPAHQVTVIARVTASGVTASLAATIEVVPLLVLTDTDLRPNILAVPAAVDMPVLGVTLVARHGETTLTNGVTYTLTGPDLFTVNAATGAISAARQLTEGNTGDYPVTLTATHPRGLPGSLPLIIEVFRGVSVCERTPVVEDEIMRLINSGREETYSCNFVPPHRLASISILNLSGRLGRAVALQADDFARMTGLEELDLGSLGITAVSEASLPQGLFRETTNLRVLNLRNSRLMPLPPRLLADLERPPRVTAGFDAAARIGRIQYLLDGAAITAPLTLDEEGDSLSLQVRVAGGFPSTLTLVFRADGVSLAATPTAIEFGPFSSTNMAFVELRALRDQSPVDSAGQAFHAWEMFDPAAGGAAEVRAQGLRVNVRNVETFSFEDADPSPNTIAVSAARGTNVAGVAPTVRVGGVAVTTGVEYTLTGSALFAVNSTSGAIVSTRLVRDGDRGSHPVTLTAAYRGAAESLPLAIGVHPAGGFDICDRTPVVQEEILYRVNTLTEVQNLGIEYGCADIPATRMASVLRLNFSQYSTTVETLRVHDFYGLAGLTNLNLGSLGLRRLPPAVFRSLSNLSDLSLYENNLASLPPDVFSDLRGLIALSLYGNNLTSLPPGIFSAQPILTSLVLSENNLTSLPPDVFSGLTNLQILELAGNGNLVLPAQVAADLERQPLFDLQIDRSVRIGGIQYFLDGSAITQLALNEGESRNFQVRIDGGVGSTLTLVARTEGVPPRAVTPTTIRFSPLSGATDTAVVEMTPPADDDFEGSTGSVSWAWMVSIGGDTVEIRVPGLPLDVRDPDGLEDADPAPNQISETASAGDSVSGWSPRVVVGGNPVTGVSYRLSSDAGGLFAIHAGNGELSLAPGQALDYTVSTFHQVTVIARVTASGVTASLVATIEVLAGLTLSDADPLANTIDAIAMMGTRVAGITPVLRNGSEVLTDGVMYSLAGPDLFAVNTTSGAISAARQFTEGDVRAYPVTLTASHSSGMASLPLVIEVFLSVSICDRTPAVRDEILRVLNSRYTCDAVPPAALASISALAIPRQRVETLLVHDFAGMPALTTLTLAGLNLTGLPEGIFRDTTNLLSLNLADNRLTSLPPGIFMNLGRLQALNLAGLAATGLPETVFSGSPNLHELFLFESGLTSLPPGIFRNLRRNPVMPLYLELSLSNNLMELPAPLLADLEKIGPVFLGLDTEVNRRRIGLPGLRIGGIRYRLDGAITTALTLNEGESRNLQIEAVGGVGSTLTLVFRAGAASRLTATPPTIRLTASRSTAAVTLTVPPDLNTGDRSGPASWAWASYLPTGLTELPSPDLQVTVRDTHRFDDTDPAPNRIGETAPAGVAVSGWSPQVLVGGVVQTNVRYSLPSDAGGLFGIDTASGALSLAPGRRLNRAASPYEITVAAQAPSGVTGSLAATIEVFTLALEDADPAPNTIAATAPPGTPVSGVRPVLLVDGAAVADGVFYTLDGPGLFTVATASGMISSAGALGGAGVHPVTLTATYRGAPADLPLTIIVRAEGSLNICGRTPLVQMEILYRVNTLTEVQSLGTPYECGSIPTTYMASVRLLDFSRYTTTVATLRVDDFGGLTGLTELNLNFLSLQRLPPGIFSGLRALGDLSLNGNSLTSLPPGIFSGLPLNVLSLSGASLTSLPPGIFSGLPLSFLFLNGNFLTSLPPDVFSDLTSLDDLDLSGNSNLELPARAVADLEGLHLTRLRIDRNARIGGFRYLAPRGFSFAGNVLLLDEGDRLNLRIEAIGGVRSTLTLVLRVDNDAPQFTVTPTTVRFSPLSNTDTAVVELAVPADETIDSASAGMSWAWTMFPGLPSAATEIRTQLSLGVIVNDDSGLVDTDPADNRISEAASPGDLVSGWSPQVLVDGVAATEMRYRLSLDAGGLFQIHPTSGTLSLASGRMLNHDTTPVHTIRVVAQASGSEWPLTTTIFVDNDMELSISGVVTGSISEAAAPGTVVSGLGVSLLNGGVPVADPGGVAWSLPGASSQVFSPALSDMGLAILRLAGALDYETTPVHMLTLRAEYLGDSVTTQVTVHVLDAEERVTLEAVGPTPFRIGEGSQVDLRVGSVRATDETGNELTSGVFYRATGDEKFNVGSNGDIRVEGQLDFEASTSHTLFITALYEELVSNQLRVDIVVLDSENDLQLVDQLSARNIASNTTGGRVRGLDLVFQIDGVNQAGTVSAWFLSDGSGLFDINSATGAITLREPIEFAPQDYDIYIGATWTGADGAPMTPLPLPLNIEINDGIPVRIRVFFEGAVIP